MGYRVVMIFRQIFQALIKAILLSSFLSTSLLAQDTKPLPNYVVEQFGPAPTVPQGPLSPAMQFAARVAFIDSISLAVWDNNQHAALAAIAKSEDPRFVWIIGDMLRFAGNHQQWLALTQAASTLLGKTFQGDAKVMRPGMT